MQDDINNRTVNLCVTTTKFEARTLKQIFLAILRARRNHKQNKKHAIPAGKQKLEDLMRHNQTLDSKEIDREDLKGIERVCRKYSIDYAVKRNPSTDPPTYMLFLQAKDNVVMDKAMEEYTRTVLEKRSREKQQEKQREQKTPAKTRDRQRGKKKVRQRVKQPRGKQMPEL